MLLLLSLSGCIGRPHVDPALDPPFSMSCPGVTKGAGSGGMGGLLTVDSASKPMFHLKHMITV